MLFRSVLKGDVAYSVSKNQTEYRENAYKESIINAYEIKTGLSRAKLSHLMDSETWMNALKAKELGFCDEVLYTDNGKPDDVSGFSFARRTADACLMNRVIASMPMPPAVEIEPTPVHPEPTAIKPEPDNRVKAADLEKRLALLK